MSNWLIGLSEQNKTDEDLLQESVRGLDTEERQRLIHDLDPLRNTQIDDMRVKIATAVRHGQELAKQSPELEKIAFIPAMIAGAARLAPMAGRAVGALGGAKGIIGGVAKDMAVSAAGNKIMGALKPAAPAAAAAGQVAGGFKYAFAGAGAAGGLLQRAAGYAVRNPGTALTAAGAVGGAVMAPRDETGQKQYMRGALMGGGLAAGANAISNGAIAGKMRSAVMNRESPLLGQGARKYLMNSAAATKGSYPKASPVRPSAAPASGASGGSGNGFFARAGDWMKNKMQGAGSAGGASGGYAGGPTMGNVKVAQNWEKIAEQIFVNMSPAERICFIAEVESFEKKANKQALVYDPSTKTFMKNSIDAAGTNTGAPIQKTAEPEWGTREYLQSRLQQAGVSSSRHSNIRAATASFAPAAGPATNPTTMMRRPNPAIAAAALPGRAGGVAGIAGAGAVAKSKFPSLAGAVSVARK